MDKIIIENLEVFGYHGVLPEENKLGQKFLVSAKIHLNMAQAGVNDDLNLTVNYADICNFIYMYMKNNTFRLIEAAAEHLVRSMLLRFEKINSVELMIKKPWAPIGLPVDYVAVEIERKWHTAYVALGSNMGDKLNYLENAVAEIKENPYCKLEKVSDIIVTEPIGEVEQEEFLNGCMEIRTVYTPIELLDFLHKLENRAGRKREVHWGPRTLDLDILLYDDMVTCDEILTIPHPEMHKRAFVLEPLKQIAPNVIHPLLKQRICDMI